MPQTQKGAKEAARRKKEENPQHFSVISKSAKKPRGGKNSPGSFKPGNHYAAIGGSAGKRGKGKKIEEVDVNSLQSFKLDFENLESDKQFKKVTKKALKKKR